MNGMQDYLKRGAAELGLSISPGQMESFAIYARELRKWNSKINLTSLTSGEDIAIKHFIDSLSVIKYADLSGELLDMGSGGGFPGIPLMIVAPETRVVSVDAVEKKINFQRHIARTLALDNFTALHGRVEELAPRYKNYFRTIISRAFTDISLFAKYSLPLLTEDGTIIAMKGKEGKKEAESAGAELKSLGVTISAVHEFALPLLKDLRSLVFMKRG